MFVKVVWKTASPTVHLTREIRVFAHRSIVEVTAVRSRSGLQLRVDKLHGRNKQYIASYNYHFNQSDKRP